jgi:CRISPR-associated Csx2 family protein
MARKVFISILGTGTYGSCKYTYGDFTAQESRFVQTATLEWIGANNWIKEDTAFIFLTKQARTSNWEVKENKRKQKDFSTCEEKEIDYIGLRQCIEEMELPFTVHDIDIADGKDEKEIWQIFETLYNNIKKNDELYIDLTHSFRYLPMLLLVLSNYAKFLKNISVVHISYGNYEARDNDIAPFVDLLPIVALQDWTIAAKDFIDYGKVKDLHQLLKEKYKSIHREKNTEEKALINVDKKLKKISESINANKLDDIIKGENLYDEINILRGDNEIIPEPFFPLVEKIEDKLQKFGQDDLGNVFAATDWCIKHELYQNAYSILLEGVISIVLNQTGKKYQGQTPYIEAKRGIITYVADCKIAKDKETKEAIHTKETCIGGYSVPFKLQNEAEQLRNIVGKIWDFIDKDIANVIVGLNATRNSFMHAGTGTNPLGSFADLKNKIKKYDNDLSEWYKTKISPINS